MERQEQDQEQILDYEKRLTDFLGYRIEEVDPEEDYDRSWNIVNGDTSMGRIQKKDETIYSFIYDLKWRHSGCSGCEKPYVFKNENVNLRYNPFDVSGYDIDYDRYAACCYDYSAGVGLLLPPSDDPKINRQNYYRKGFYMFLDDYESGKSESVTLLLCSSDDPLYPGNIYVHEIDGDRTVVYRDDTGTVVATKENYYTGAKPSIPVSSIEEYARNDVGGIELFERVRKIFKETHPNGVDVLSKIFTKEEIERFGLSVYFSTEPEKRRVNNKGNKGKKDKEKDN